MTYEEAFLRGAAEGFERHKLSFAWWDTLVNHGSHLANAAVTHGRDLAGTGAALWGGLGMASKVGLGTAAGVAGTRILGGAARIARREGVKGLVAAPYRMAGNAVRGTVGLGIGAAAGLASREDGEGIGTTLGRMGVGAGAGMLVGSNWGGIKRGLGNMSDRFMNWAGGAGKAAPSHTASVTGAGVPRISAAPTARVSPGGHASTASRGRASSGAVPHSASVGFPAAPAAAAPAAAAPGMVGVGAPLPIPAGAATRPRSSLPAGVEDPMLWHRSGS